MSVFMRVKMKEMLRWGVETDLKEMDVDGEVAEHQFFALLPGAGNCEAVCSNIYAQFALSFEA